MTDVKGLDFIPYIEFTSPVAEMVRFDDKLLIRLEDGTYHISTDGRHFKEFYFISKVEHEVLNEK